MNAGLDSAVNVSVYESVVPVTVAWKCPTLGLSLGGLSWNPLSLALNVCDASSALAAATVSPRTPTIAAERRIHLNVMCAPPTFLSIGLQMRSEERRVGKAGRAWWTESKNRINE